MRSNLIRSRWALTRRARARRLRRHGPGTSAGRPGGRHGAAMPRPRLAAREPGRDAWRRRRRRRQGRVHLACAVRPAGFRSLARSACALEPESRTGEATPCVLATWKSSENISKKVHEGPPRPADRGIGIHCPPARSRVRGLRRVVGPAGPLKGECHRCGDKLQIISNSKAVTQQRYTTSKQATHKQSNTANDTVAETRGVP